MISYDILYLDCKRVRQSKLWPTACIIVSVYRLKSLIASGRFTVAWLDGMIDRIRMRVSV